MESPLDATGYLERGKERRDRGELEEALADFDEAIRQDAANVEAYLCRGHLRQNSGDVLGGTEDYSAAARIDLEQARLLAPPGVSFGETPNVITLHINPARAAQGEQPPLTAVALVSALVWTVLGCAAVAAAGWWMAGVAVDRSWTAWAWLGLPAAWGALTATFALCFGFGVAFIYLNGGPWLGSMLDFAWGGAGLGLLLGGLLDIVYFSSSLWLGLVTGFVAASALLAVAGSLLESRYGVRTEEAFPLRNLPLALRLAVLAGAFGGGIVVGWLTGTGQVSAGLVKGGIVGLLVALPLSFYLWAIVVVLRGRVDRGRNVLRVGGLLGGLVGGAVAGAFDLDRLYGAILAGVRGGIFGALGGILGAVVVGLVGGRFCPGRTRSDSFSGAMGAALRLRPGPHSTSGIFSAAVGLFPGAAVGVWCGTVLGVLGYLGEGREGALVWFVAAPITGALLALIFFGNRVVLQGAGTPRSGRGMIGVALAGAVLGASVAGVARALAISVGSPEYWMAGMAATGCLLGAKCWEFLGGDALSPPLF